MIALLIVLPLAIAAMAALLLSESAEPIRFIALAASLVTLLFVAIVNFGQASPAIEWFSSAGFTLTLTTATAPLNMLLMAVISVITPLIIFYSFGAVEAPSEQGRYYFLLCSCAASMLLLAMAGDLIVVLIGWWILSICSYLLTGFWHKKERALAAARKTLMVMLIADFAMLAAALLVWCSYQTFSFAAILQAQQSNQLKAALLLVLFAAFVKSAQFPFQESLPGSVEGPVPVSAFMNSITSKAGVFLVAALLPLFAGAGMLWIMLVVGSLTAVIGAANSLFERQINKVLVYSTVTDLGLLFIALGLNSVMAAMMLFVAQSFCKALLFMSAGIMIKANGEEESIDRIQYAGMGKPLLTAVIIGVIAMAGMFPLGDFFGKFVVESAAGGSLPFYLLLVAIGFNCSICAFRWFIVPPKKQVYHLRRADYEFMPRSMLFPVYILMGLTAAASVICALLPGYLGAAPVAIGAIGAVSETVFVLIGFAIAYIACAHRLGLYLGNAHKRFYAALYNGALFNEAYAIAAKVAVTVCSLAYTLEGGLLWFMKDMSKGFFATAWLLNGVEDGRSSTYLLAFMLGIIFIAIMLIVI